jgi:PadR family transcriptional regulator
MVGMDAPLTTRAALLLALRDGPGYGLDLIRRVSERSAGRVRLSAARVYPSLKKLEREKLVRATRGAPRALRGGRAPTYYDLTLEGVHASTECRDAVAALAAGRPKPRLSAAQKRRMAERLLLCDELSTAAAALATARKKRGRVSSIRGGARPLP